MTLPDNSCIQSNEEGTIPLLSLLSLQAKKASIMPKMKSSLLISLRQLAGNNCTTLLDKEKESAFKEKEIILQGIRNKFDGLWDIPIFKRKYRLRTTSCHLTICQYIRQGYPRPIIMHQTNHISRP